MKISLLTPAGRRQISDVTIHHATAEGACPSCSASPFLIAGNGKHPSNDDRAYEADGFCLACKASVGTIRAETSTIFGVREDEAVLNGRCRVYQ